MPKKNKLSNCRIGYTCGNSCISKKRKCVKALRGEPKTYAQWLQRAAIIQGDKLSPQHKAELTPQQLARLTPTDETRADFRKWFDSDFKRYDFDDALEASGLREDQSEELVGLRRYTGSSYTRMNQMLRSAFDEDIYGETTTRQVVAEIQFAAAALRNMPKFEGATFRGTQVTPQTIQEYKNRIGGQIEEMAFSSSSVDEDTALSFMGYEQREGRRRVMYYIESRNGVDVDPVSYNQSEKEILFTPGTRYNVLDVQDPGDDYVRVYLREA